ncbi:hypothetical protein ACFQO8_14550 [Exiguobacterium aestuarii]|uniref:Uncharacterized protein n=1 Tax=Exiguobacterium aestuarii TaxID=273527 RepID=A0ABW2PPG8_9BACL|nr:MULTISPECIES: hypothetical protein [Exiguobacterium]MCT4786261.1 hypothetical protein [Exiguobacterium aestuarii]
MKQNEKEVTVRTAKELKQAVQNKEKVIIVEGELAKKLEPLEKLKKSKNQPDINSEMSTPVAAMAMASVTAVSTAVWIVLIIAVSLLVLVALYKNYDVEVSKGDTKMKFTRN